MSKKIEEVKSGFIFRELYGRDATSLNDIRKTTGWDKLYDCHEDVFDYSVFELSKPKSVKIKGKLY